MWSTQSWCSDIMNHQQIWLRPESLSGKLSILNLIRQDLEVELREYLPLHSLILGPKSRYWDKLTLDGQPTSVVSNITTIVKFQHSSCQWSCHHLWAWFAKWQIEHSRLTRLSPSNCKRDTKAGSMPWEEFLWKKDHTSFSETHSPFTPNTFWVPSLPSTPSTGSKTRLPSSTESPTLPSGRLSGLAPVLPLTLAVSSATHSTTQLEKS